MRGQLLILDDNPLDVKVAAAHLKSFAFEVFGFTAPDEALEHLEKNQVQVIILDLNMPRIDGFEMIKELRRNPQTKDTPIIIISGRNQSEDVKKAIQLGASDFIVKPIDPLVFQEKISKMLDRDSENFATVAVQKFFEQSVYIKSHIEILELSEFGMKVKLPFRIELNSIVELGGLDEKFFGEESLYIKCMSSTEATTGAEYIIHASFVGLSEAKRKTIRQSCRTLWVRQKIYVKEVA